MNAVLALLWKIALRVSGDITPDLLRDLLSARSHSGLVQRRRAALIIVRVRMVAALFAVLTPLWIVIDMLTLDCPLWGWLAVLRVLASLAFGCIAVLFRNTESVSAALRALGWLLAIPTVFFLVSHPLLGAFDISPVGQALAAGYAFLPFVVLAGLSVFPITATEGVIFSAPLILAKLVVSLAGFQVLPFNSHIGALWLMLLLAVVATLAGMSQLHFMIALVKQSSHDVLTRAYTRRVGEEMLEILFATARRGDQSIAVAFIDLDDFKSVNDIYGHEAGDETLRNACEHLRKVIRGNDMLVRWGGEEFLVLMPGTDCDGADVVIRRLRERGLGPRPEGKPQTASVGVAERKADACESWTELVEKADQRMYAAKQSGKNRVCTCQDVMFS